MEEKHQSDQRQPPDSGADILLIEDSPFDAELTLRALEQCGSALQVVHVTDGGEALDYIANTTFRTKVQATSLPKLILLDLSLRKIGGLHVLRRLKSDQTTKKIPIVALTASEVEIELAESYKLGVNSYVLKPLSASKFTEVVAAIGHYWLDVNMPPPAL